MHYDSGYQYDGLKLKKEVFGYYNSKSRKKKGILILLFLLCEITNISNHIDTRLDFQDRLQGSFLLIFF